MEPYQQRVVGELEELTDKVNKLRDFVLFGRTKYGISVSEAEVKRLYMQLNAMVLYQAILEQRIENFVVDPGANV